MWEAITWQWTEYGQIHREFDSYYDWMHHGEANLFLYFFGFTKPESLKDRQRAQRFAGMYNGEDAEADNYDVERGLIRAPQSGSRGPRLVVTKEDLSTHRGVLDDYLAPFEDMVTSPFELGTCNWSNDDVFDEVVRLMNERTTRGDVPLNMNASGQMIHAYMYSGEQKYLEWVVDYLDRWHQRALDNGGVLPDNVGLSGVVGEYLDGKWWGGHYGWRWPHGYLTIIEPTVNICVNALMLTGDVRHVALARLQIGRGLLQQVDGHVGARGQLGQLGRALFPRATPEGLPRFSLRQLQSQPDPTRFLLHRSAQPHRRWRGSTLRPDPDPQGAQGVQQPPFH
jgi:hypothetical protein